MWHMLSFLGYFIFGGYAGYLWKYAGAWLKPNGHLVNSNLSKGVAEADLALASGDNSI